MRKWTTRDYVVAIVGILALAGVIVYSGISNDKWKRDCRSQGNLIVETYDNGLVCVDRDGRIVS